jgi:hypothetical protein
VLRLMASPRLFPGVGVGVLFEPQKGGNECLD